jgi:hypothetical protein
MEMEAIMVLSVGSLSCILFVILQSCSVKQRSKGSPIHDLSKQSQSNCAR